MLKWLQCLLLVLLLVGGKSAQAQQDTIFWFAAPEVAASEGESPIHLRFLTFGSPATVTISQPANGGFTPIVTNIAANDFAEVDLTPLIASIESPAADVVSANGLRIESTAPITAYYELGAANNKEIFSLKGTKGIGTNFYTPFQTLWDNATTTPGSFSSIDIVATEDNTTVLITPRTNVVGHGVGSSYAVTLNEGETYSARDVDLSAATSLAGSIVSSNNPIAVTVFSGALMNGGCNSAMGDQITTADFLGTDFVVHKGTATNERVFILATQNGTTIEVNNTGTTSTLINWSETYEVTLTDTFNYISTNKPVYVWHASGNGCNLSGAQMPALYCSGTYSSLFSRASSDSLGVALYTRTGFEDDFALNGNGALIPSSAFTDVPGTNGDFKMAMLWFNTTEVPVGSYNEVTNAGDIFGLSVMNGSNGNGSGYAFVSEFTSYPFVNAGLDDTICGNTTLALNGVVGGGDVTGYWSGNGFGGFQLSVDSLNNVYIPSPLDTIVSPIELILTSNGPCPVRRDSLTLWVTPAPIVNAGADQAVCSNNAHVLLDGSVTGGTTTGVWSTTGTGTFAPDANTFDAVYTPSAADTTAGMVEMVLTATNTGACASVTDTMNIMITAGPGVEAGPDTISVCANNPQLNLAGSVNGPTVTGKWLTTGNGQFTPDNLDLNASYDPSPDDVNGGSITLYLESTGNGNCLVVTDSIVVIFTPAPTVDAGVNFTACSNDPTVQLNGSITGPTSSGEWSGGAGTFNPGNTDLNATYTPSASEINAGSFFLTLTSTNNGNCFAESDDVLVSLVAEPTPNFSFTEVCFEDSSSFADFSLPGFGTITSWNWDFGDANTSVDQNPDHLYGAPGTYDVQLITTTSVGCTDTLVQQVQVFELPTANFNWEATCATSQVIVFFEDSSYTANDDITSWFYDFGGQGSISAQNPAQLFVGDGNFVVTQIVTTNNGCVDTTVQIVTIPAQPQAGFVYQSTNGLNIGATFEFSDTSYNSVDWDWNFGDGSGSSQQDPTNVYFENGNYVVTQWVYNELGCVDSTSQLITINTVTTEINTLIPNAISPNGDGKNDVWKLEFLDLLYPDAEVEVYNRWGQRLFYSQGYETPWDGTFDNEPVPAGTYYYVINLNDPNEPEPFKGTILVLRQRQ